MATKKKTIKKIAKKTTKKTINFEKCYNKLMKDLDNVYFRLLDTKHEVCNGTICNKDLTEEMWEITHMMTNIFSEADKAIDPFYNGND